MTLFSAQIAASADDAQQSADTVTLGDNNINISATTQYGGFRFNNVTIPAGATINSADITLTTYSDSYDDPDTTIYGEDIDDAPAFTTTTNNISGRTLTTASVAWTATNIGTANKASPDIKSIIQEIIDRPGWTSGNDIAIIIKGNSGTSTFRVRAYDYGSGYPQLNIDYTAGGGGSPQPPRTMHQTRIRTI